MSCKGTVRYIAVFRAVFLCCLSWCAGGRALAAPHARLEKASREDRAGWIFLHLEGKPRDIGYQYGALLAPEIDDTLHALQFSLKPTGREWSFYREAAHRLFWDKTDLEYQQEIAGIAEGLKTKGFAYDTDDILALNGHIELVGYYLPILKEKKTGLRTVSRAPIACSAFVATGSATKDGKVVMGHNFWWDYLMGERWRVILDIRPERGERVLMDSLPGLIHSGTDFALNSAGILITETTISGFKGFDENGIPEFVRARKAAQYSQSLDDFARIMREGNNGGYANTWLIADTKTREIGKLELGLRNVAFSRTKDGAYYGANYPEDPKVAGEECKDYKSAFDFCCTNRRARWQKLMSENNGRIDAEMGRRFLEDTYDEVLHKQGASMGTLCGRGDQDRRTGFEPTGAVNAKVVTSDMAAEMRFWARMGFPDGSDFSTKEFFEKHAKFRTLSSFLRDMPSNPWTVFQARKMIHE